MKKRLSNTKIIFIAVIILFIMFSITFTITGKLAMEGPLSFLDINKKADFKPIVIATPPAEIMEGYVLVATLKDTYIVNEEVKLTDPPFIDKVVKTSETIKPPQQFQKISQKYKGYIVEFKEKPLLVKQTELKEEIESKKQKAEQTGWSFLRNWRLKKVEDLEVDLKENLINQELKIKKEKTNAKQKISKVLNKEISLLADFKNTFNGIALDITDEEAEKIKKLKEVKKIYPNYEVYPALMDSISLINADDVWVLKDCEGRKITGKDVTIAVIDTGVDYTHPDLGGCLGSNCKVIGGYDFVDNDNDPMDEVGHGTHCASIAAGDGILKGVAPDAKLYAYRVVVDRTTPGWVSNMIAAIERAVDPDQDEDFSDHVNIITISLASFGNPDDPQSRAVDNAVDAGVVVVVAAGNTGDMTKGLPFITSPGTARKAITVGATDKEDKVASFSARGPAMWIDKYGKSHFLKKPDLVGPGVAICAAQWNDAYETYGDSNCNNDDNHITLTGTSMATPHVAGAAALLLQKYPNLGSSEVKNILTNTAIDLGYDHGTQGYGKVDALSAISGVKSKIQNTGDTNIEGYLLMKIEYYKYRKERIGSDIEPILTGIVTEKIIVDETTPRIIKPGEYLSLDGIWEEAGSYKPLKKGKYRVYVALRNFDGSVLIAKDGNMLKSTYDFIVE